jgi:hypothetical protein
LHEAECVGRKITGLVDTHVHRIIQRGIFLAMQEDAGGLDTGDSLAAGNPDVWGVDVRGSFSEKENGEGKLVGADLDVVESEKRGGPDGVAPSVFFTAQVGVEHCIFIQRGRA